MALPDVHRVGLALVIAGGRQLSFTATDRERERVDWCHVDAYEDVPLNNTVRSGRLIVGSLPELAGRYPDFVGRQSRSTSGLASIPLVAARQVLGGFVLSYEARQPFDEGQLEELRRLGERLGVEIRAAARTTTLPNRPSTGEPLPIGARAATHIVIPDPQSVPGARHFAWDTLTAWSIDGDARDAAVLCVSELVTNAIIHTFSGCEVRLVLHHGVLTTSVRDGGTGGRLDRSAGDPLAAHGRGLHLVEALSASWGSQRDTDGLTVWCELETTGH
jgi:hypothetical protein